VISTYELVFTECRNALGEYPLLNETGRIRVDFQVDFLAVTSSI